jgi:hypothetical protein
MYMSFPGDPAEKLLHNPLHGKLIHLRVMVSLSLDETPWMNHLFSVKRVDMEDTQAIS